MDPERRRVVVVAVAAVAVLAEVFAFEDVVTVFFAGVAAGFGSALTTFFSALAGAGVVSAGLADSSAIFVSEEERASVPASVVVVVVESESNSASEKSEEEPSSANSPSPTLVESATTSSCLPNFFLMNLQLTLEAAILAIRSRTNIFFIRLKGLIKFNIIL
jgi:hypothetical protein